MPMRHRLLLTLLALFAITSVADLSGVGDRLQFAEGLFRRNMFDLALREYQGLIQDGQTDVLDIALFRAGECHRRLNQTDPAIAAYTRVVEEFPGSLFHARAAFRWAELELARNNPAIAAELFQALLKRNPSPDIAAATRYNLGRAQERQNQTREAEKTYRAVIKDFPSSPFRGYAAMALASLLEARDGPVKELRRLYQGVADRPETPDQGAEALYRLIEVEARAGAHATAADLYERIATTYPDHARTRNAAFTAASANLQAGRAERTLELTTAALNQPQPVNPPAWHYLAANASRSLGRTDAAIRDYRAVLTAPDHELAEPAALELAGLLLPSTPPDVIALLEPMTPTESRRDDHDWLLARAYARTGQIAPAGDRLQRLIDHAADPDRRASAAYEFARLAQQERQWTEASTRFEAFAKTYPRHELAPAALHAAGIHAVRADDPARARALWTQLLEKHPDFPEREAVLLGKARAEIALDQTSDARDTLQALIRAFPSGPFTAEAHFLRGQLFEEDTYEASDFHYLAALRLDPPPDLALSIHLRRIAALQRLGRHDEAANLLADLITTDFRREIPEPLLEWLARWNLEREAYAAAALAADLLAKQAATPGWQQAGHHIAGTARMRLGETDLAIRDFTAALDLPVASRAATESALHLGDLYRQQNKLDQALASYQRAAELATDDTEIDLRARAYAGLGYTHRDAQRWEDAAKFFFSVGVLFDDPDLTPECLHLAAEAFAHLNRTTDRDRVLRELIERYPDHPRAQAAATPPAPSTPEPP